jgi:hypothetical protein
MLGVSKNISKPERWARAIVSLFLIPSAFVYGYTLFPLLQSFIGLIFIYNAVSGICWTSRLFGVKTCER